jgi:hypothetical protein
MNLKPISTAHANDQFGVTPPAAGGAVLISNCVEETRTARNNKTNARKHMKTLRLLTLTLVTGTALMLPPAIRAGILGSPHDFSGEAWNVKPSDHNSVCGPCHTPHHADSTVVPLWAHATTTATFQMYNNANVAVANLQANVDSQPAGISKACLSCHDGTIAINTYGGAVQGGTAVTITNSALIGTDLTHTHPISLTYDNTIAGTGVGKDKWLFDPDTAQVLTPDSGTFVSGNDMTVNGFLLGGRHRVECSSCHDVHNQSGTPYDQVNNPKLVKIVGTQAGKGSLLCRSCHNK